MKPLFSFALAVATLAIGQAQAPQKPVALFDGRSFAGWEGDIKGTWRIQDGALVGGSQTAQVPRNEFLCTTKTYGDFELKVTFKLTGDKTWKATTFELKDARLLGSQNGGADCRIVAEAKEFAVAKVTVNRH
jgi:hypothetical protein